jgi:hypothetical protein
MNIAPILETYIFSKVKLTTDRGVEFTGYIVDVKLPVVTGIAIYFLEESKAKRYLAKFNAAWLMPLPVDMITEIEKLDFDDISEILTERRISFYD